VEDPALRAQLADAITAKGRLALSHPEAEFSETAAQFAANGIAPLPDLVSPAEAAEILEYLKNCSDVVSEDSVRYHRLKDVVRAPHVFRIATDPRVLSVAHSHLKFPPTVVEMSAWRSLPEGNPVGAQVFHRDRDDFRACKLFVYLNDVKETDGPHIVVRGSHRADAVAATLAAKGVPLKKLGAFFTGNGRDIASVIEQVFGPDVIELTGPPGTAFLENTYAFHRGKIPTQGARYILQVLYAVIPYPSRLTAWSDTALHILPPDCAREPRARAALRLAVGERTPRLAEAEDTSY
jgi:hypothetical protein